MSSPLLVNVSGTVCFMGMDKEGLGLFAADSGEKVLQIYNDPTVNVNDRGGDIYAPQGDAEEPFPGKEAAQTRYEEEKSSSKALDEDNKPRKAPKKAAEEPVEEPVEESSEKTEDTE